MMYNPYRSDKGQIFEFLLNETSTATEDDKVQVIRRLIGELTDEQAKNVATQIGPMMIGRALADAITALFKK